ncbi:PIN/TRAM domain-containing protein [Synergistales bacterium]|nr:PIN/TRAM domain-containing protein [Synergistales bacterium]
MAESGITGIMKFMLRFLLTMICAVAGYQTAALMKSEMYPKWLAELAHPNIFMISSIILFAFIGFLLTPFVWWLLKKTGQVFEGKLQNVSAQDVVMTIFGLIVSLIVANLIAVPFYWIPGMIGFYIAVGLNIFFAFIGIRAFLKKRDAIRDFFAGFAGFGERITHRRKKEEAPDGAEGENSAHVPAEAVDSNLKVLDTSALIDGRILDIARTGFLEGTLVLPRFVLTELQGVSDSSDSTRRARGRKGMSVVSELQQTPELNVIIRDISMKALHRDKVDEALVELCKYLGAKIITTDYNLNQVARIQGVSVLNVNDLANSLKPQFLPGDVARIEVIRSGKEAKQGVGYLEDGTMLVVEDGESAIGHIADIVITSMLQTSAGRMVFGKLKH